MTELKQDFYKNLKLLAENDDLDDEDDDDEEEEKFQDNQLPQKAQNKFPSFIKLHSQIIHAEQFIQHLQHITQPTQELSVTKQLVSRTNQYLTRLELQFSQTLFRSVQHLSHPYFPELETIITSPRDYLELLTAFQFGSIPHQSLLQIDLTKILPNDVAFNIKVSLSSSKGRELSSQQSSKLQIAVKQSNQVRNHKQTLQKYLESQMEILAPNTLAFLQDPNLTARLIAAAGGIKQLAQSSNIQVMGSYKKNTGAMSTQHAKLHRGIIAQSDLVKASPKQNERQMVRMLSTKCALAARVDMFGSKRDGSEGKKLREGVISRFKKISQAAPPRAKKPLPAPIEKSSTK